MNLQFLTGNVITKFFLAASSGDKPKPTLWETTVKNAVYVAVFFGIIVAMFLIAFALEKLCKKKNGQEKKEKFFTTYKMAVIGILTAMATVLMIFDFPIWFIPSFYKLDFSELPVLIGSFAFGPATGVVMEFLKVFLKLLIKGTSTAFIGELANFVVGCSLIIPAATIYAFKKTKKTAILSCVFGTIILVVFASVFNAIYLIPAFTKFMSLDQILAQGAEKNSLVNADSMTSFVIFAVAPLNLIKGVAVSIVTMLIYKPLSRFIKGNNR
ncbi:MAG: ECF transporter S component [Lachnospiraceae bacterium]|nr:ECF transporter S component [Lachnospiraceae bacterium]MBR6475629.1 ECF transporter S component [Lachnospiraceae bacterium]